jgi:hypothetical protein
MTMAPNLESAAAAVETLRAQLEMANGSLEAIDRKAALVPATLGVVAGIFIRSDDKFTPWETAALIAAIGTGIASVLFALRVLWTRLVSIGPNATRTASETHLDPASYNRAVAGSLALSIEKMSEVAKWKSDHLNRSFGFAGVTILLLAVARLLGGLT